MSNTKEGSRKPDGVSPHLYEPGDYGRWDGEWYAQCPPGNLLAGLARHSVVEHEDGTITVSPSILCGDGEGGHQWHGFLERGVWREC